MSVGPLLVVWRAGATTDTGPVIGGLARKFARCERERWPLDQTSRQLFYWILYCVLFIGIVRWVLDYYTTKLLNYFEFGNSAVGAKRGSFGNGESIPSGDKIDHPQGYTVVVPGGGAAAQFAVRRELEFVIPGISVDAKCGNPEDRIQNPLRGKMYNRTRINNYRPRGRYGSKVRTTS